ncbi:NucA/NucB deoxyribonuclease domain-containing protein [Actinokineospora sp. NBRC 105648]|uniref:NucA/NucB deoxyribonuclease domain-containing protein n=1 Tax=Actinokineospora sp. NBRC 105648 TaxID=3032206 RepID=UPI00255399E6|nr:NucA/NucB deoxyribonuclease domain-containing protein [Actinokineospora sp. NBRC 105648]
MATKAVVGIPQDQLDQLRAKAKDGKQATRPEQPQAAGRQPSDKPEPVTTVPLAESARQARVSAAQHAVDTGTAAAAPIGNRPDAALLDACFKGSSNGEFGRIHNRFTHCVRASMEVEYWSVNQQGVPIRKEGVTKATLEIFTQGDDTQRRVRSFARVQRDSVDYDWGWFDNLFVAPNVPLSIMNQCAQGSDVCFANDGAATMPWIVWDNSDFWFHWDVYNREESGAARDKVSYNHWYFEYFTDFPPYKTLQRGRTEARQLRCDSATYFNFGSTRYPKACVFSEVTSRLTYHLDSDHRSVALHIFGAQTRPNETYPLLVPPGTPAPRDKRIPGEFQPTNPNAPSLHRITSVLQPGETKANEEHKQGACYKEGPYAAEYLDTGLPVRPNPPAEQCDEYPFASTLEGAANPFWDFSVRAVPQRDNSVAGGLLITHYVQDRVLAWDQDLAEVANDRFYVEIR